MNVTAGDDSAMTEPDDFGFNTVRTMTHVVDPVPSLDHSGFWKRWYTRLLDVSPTLRPRIVDDPSDPSATHEFESLAGVKVGCALVVPKNAKPIERALVTTHGYTNPDSLGDSVRHWQTIADQGVAVLIVRLRGYRGSQIGIGDMTTPDAIGAGWIARGFGGHKPEEWILPDAVGDVCNAVRVMRDILLRRGEIDLDLTEGPAQPGVWLHGRSLGGGIGTIAAAQLIGRLANDTVVDRLAIALPSLGAWAWRLHQRATGTTIDINKVIAHHSDRADELFDRVRLCDSAIHAAHVRIPTLAMLACRDEVAPAPSAAAVYNAIDAGPGQKWRFVVPYGHFEGGINNARRHALFDRAMTDFFDPACTAPDAMERWEDTMSAIDQEPPGETP
ncbi:MAG: acetylxylan esterase [Phycisphaerales bacterium]|nr:acetylxylan esterase [Phycisphaerales bacterium]